MSPSPFSRAKRDLTPPLELPAPEPTALPDEMALWAGGGETPDGVTVETDVSEADMAKKRGEDLSPAQLSGLRALATLASREHVAREVALAQRELDRLTAIAEANR